MSLIRRNFWAALIASFLIVPTAFAAHAKKDLETEVNEDDTVGMGLTAGGMAGLGGQIGSLPAFAYGAEIVYKVIPNLHVGFEWSGVVTSALFITAAVNDLMGTARYFFWKGMYGSLSTGLGLFSVTNTFTGTSAVLPEFAIEPAIGYDFRINQNITIGPRFSYCGNFGNPLGSAHVLAGTAAIRYKF